MGGDPGLLGSVGPVYSEGCLKDGRGRQASPAGRCSACLGAENRERLLGAGRGKGPVLSPAHTFAQ